MDKNRVIFIISHKYFRGHESYIEYYVKNIQSFYVNYLIIVVDNNSLYKEDIFEKLKHYENVVLLDNNIECKFEIGAYNVGMKYLFEYNLLEKYDYVVMSQDNFIIKNKLDFNDLHNKNVFACPIVGNLQDAKSTEHRIQWDCVDVWMPILQNLGLLNDMDKISFCWCNSFIVSTNKIEQLYSYTKNIVIKIRWESCASERYLARFLWELNDYKNYSIDGDLLDLDQKYDCWNVDLYGDISTFFAKRVQQKTETTVDKSKS